MPQIKVSNMTAATSTNAVDVLMLIQNGVNKQISLTTLLNNLNSNNHFRINPNRSSLNFTVSSKDDENSIFVTGNSGYVGIGTSNPTSKLHVIGNLHVGNNTSGGVLLQTEETVSYNTSDATALLRKSISSNMALTVLNCVENQNGLFSLAQGFAGAVKTIVQNTLGSGKTSSILIPNGLGFNTLTLSKTGAVAELQFISSIAKWAIIGGYGPAGETSLLGGNGVTLTTV